MTLLLWLEQLAWWVLRRPALPQLHIMAIPHPSTTVCPYTADGTPTKALEGFCRKNGVSPADTTRQADGKGVEYVYALVKDAGRSAAEVR